MYEIKEMEQVFRVKFVTGNARIVVIDNDNPNEKFMSDSFVLLNLCRAIIELENRGHIISSVTRVEADGTHPKVRFRDTKEYRYAKKYPSQDIVSAMMTSEWADATFDIPCKVNTKNNEVFDLKCVAHPNGSDFIGEFVEFNEDSIQHPVYCLDDIDNDSENNEDEFDNVLDKMYTIKQKSAYWYTKFGKLTPDNMIRKYRWKVLRDALLSRKNTDQIEQFIGRELLAGESIASALDESEAQMPDDEFATLFEDII